MDDQNTKANSTPSSDECANITFRSKSIIKQVDVKQNLTTDDVSIVDNQCTSRLSNQFRTIENCILVWLQTNIHNSIEDKDESIIKLQNTVHLVETFIDPNECIDFITNIQDEKVFMIISQSIDFVFLSLIQDIPQLYAIYFLENDHMHVTQSIEEYRKVKGVFTSIDSICDVLKLDMARLMVDLTSFSIISTSSSANLDELDQSFMYTQLLKEIIIEIKHDDKAKQDFINYYRTHFQEAQFQLKSITQFQQYYEDHSPIWWYTKELFIYSTLNKALRTQDTETIIKMGFFLHDLHREISLKHSQAQNLSKMVVYRGQCVPESVFEKIKNNRGGLISFNNFLSTSSDRHVSLMYADFGQQNSDIVGILFRIEIDPTIDSTPYVSIRDMSNHEDEDEILFSMNTIFRITEINETSNHLWEIHLALTNDNDPELKCLTDYIRKELGVANTWYRMGLLMFKMGKFEKAFEIFDILYNTSLNDNSNMDPFSRATLRINVAVTQHLLGYYENALTCLEKALEHFENVNPSNFQVFPLLYYSIGLVHQSMGHYTVALSYMERALTSYQNLVEPNHPVFAKIYNSMAAIQRATSNYTIALSYYEKAFEICKTSLPSYHPDIATYYNNLAAMHYSMGNYTVAISYLEKALDIQQRSLPSDHLETAAVYNNIAAAYQAMGNYASALSYCERSLDIQQRTLPTDHPNLVESYNSIAAIHQSMGNYPIALSFIEKVLDVQQKSLSTDHPHLAHVYHNMGIIHDSMGNSTIALSYLEKALDIHQKYRSSDHSNIALTYNSLGSVHRSMGNYSIALSYYEKAVEMQQKSLVTDHPNMLFLYNNIGLMHAAMGNYEMAHLLFKKALDIQQKSLPHNHPYKAMIYQNIASLNLSKRDFSTALTACEKVLETQQRSLLNNRSLHSNSSNNFEAIQQQIDHEATAISQMKKMLETQERLLSKGHRRKRWTTNELEEAKEILDSTLVLRENMERALQLQQITNRTDDLFMSSRFGTEEERNQVFKSYQDALALITKATTKSKELLTLTPTRKTNIEHIIDEIDSVRESASIAHAKLLETAELQQQFTSPHDLTWVNSYNSCGDMLCKGGDYKNGLSAFEKALKTINSSASTNHGLLAKTFSNMAKALDGLGRYSEAVGYARQAVNTAYSAFDTSAAEINLYENQLARLQRKL